MPVQRPTTLAVLAAALAVPATGCAGPPPAGTVLRTEEHAVRIVAVTTGLDHPWSIAWLPDGRALVTERPGRLRILHPDGRVDPDPVAGLPAVVASGQGGLFDVAPHPDFASNGLVYLSYAAEGPDGVGTALARGRLAAQRLENVEVLFRQSPAGRTGRHFGGRIVFDGKGHVFLTLGERGEQDRAQRHDDHAGSVIRLLEDGQVPPDNPWVGQAGWKPEKYTLGNRNLQGAALHPQTGELWTNEHGPQGGDELNLVRAGANYGWPVITYGVEYGVGTKIGEGTQKPGMEQPVHFWVPSIGVSGLTFYTGERFPKWRGDAFVGSLKFGLLVRLRLDGGRVVHEERMLDGKYGRLRDVRTGPDGFLYLLTDESDGAVLRLEPAD